MPKYLKIGVSFIHRQYLPHLIMTVLFCLLSGGIMSFQNLAQPQVARALELFVSFVGVLLLTPLFLPEQDEEIWLLEKSKATAIWKLYLVRLLIGTMAMLAVVAFFIWRMWEGGSDVLVKDMYLGTFAEMMLLGAIGFCVSGITNQVVLGYMLAVIYYAINFGNNKFLGKMAMFQMAKGHYDFIGWMLLVSLLLIGLGIIIREKTK